MADRERRGLTEPVEVRGDGNGTVAGYAAMYGVETVIAGLFREQIAPGAFDAALKGDDDVRALFNHDSNIVLGRTKSGTLRLSETKKGLRYDIDLNPEDPEALRVRAMIKRGDVSGSSFGFVVKADRWDEPKNTRDLPLRTILEAELFDVSPVTFPAYPQTSVTARDIQDAAEARRVLEARRVAWRHLLAAKVALAKAWPA
jgi:HK97 family phage prohead protease